MRAATEILRRHGLGRPDCRPLHMYGCTQDEFSSMQKLLRHNPSGSAADFVLWAAEQIRRNFRGGPLKWELIFDELNWPEDQNLGRNLTERGLNWWGREVQQDSSGSRMFLYTLMAEGGIPESLLINRGKFRNVVLGLLRDVEAEGGTAAEPWLERIAERWIEQLPQAFRNPNITRLLAGFAYNLAELRARLPRDLPDSAAVRWLNGNYPGWISQLPLRMTEEIAETLIHPAILTERDSSFVTSGPLCKRELRLDQTGKWQGYLIFEDDGWLPDDLFKDSVGRRLRMMPSGSDSVDGLVYSASPEDGGWRLRRFGNRRRSEFPYDPQLPFSLVAYEDGRSKGEAVIDPGLPSADAAPSFWGAAQSSGNAEEITQLVPRSGSGKTRTALIWILAAEDADPVAAEGLALAESETAPGGRLWRVSGKGVLRLGDTQYRIETGSDDEAPDAALIPSGRILPGWRRSGNRPVYLGRVKYLGRYSTWALRAVSEQKLRRRHDRRVLFSELVEWSRNNEVLANCQIVSIPENAQLKLREVSTGVVKLEAEGLSNGLRARMTAGEMASSGEVADGCITLTLEVPGRVPKGIDLRLSDPAEGRALELHSNWPFRHGTIISPDGERLNANLPATPTALHGWRAVVPPGSKGDLQLRLKGQIEVALPVQGESSISAQRPLIEAILAQGGPDAQVDVSLAVDGESKRLEIRRYQDNAAVHNGILRVGLDRDAPISFETALEESTTGSQGLAIHAVDITDPYRTVEEANWTSGNLNELLGDCGGPWLIQSTLDGRVQRAAVWFARSLPETTRSERVKEFAEKWQSLVSEPQCPEWDRLLRLISVARRGGDPGMLDLVQALAQTPAAAITLAMRVPKENLMEIRELDASVPIFWPCIPVSEFGHAVRADIKRWKAKLLKFFDSEEAGFEADRAVLKLVNDILSIMPELAGHFGCAMFDTGLFDRALRHPEQWAMLTPMLQSDPGQKLSNAIDAAARRFDRLPSGVPMLQPLGPPPESQRFHKYLQALINGPIVAAEMAAGLCEAPDVRKKLTLINLRLVDPEYFDTALPSALFLLKSKASQT